MEALVVPQGEVALDVVVEPLAPRHRLEQPRRRRRREPARAQRDVPAPATRHWLVKAAERCVEGAEVGARLCQPWR